MEPVDAVGQLVGMDTMPGLFARVRLQDGGKIYLVVSVDPVQQMVKLSSSTGLPHDIPNVPIDAIHELVEGPPDPPLGRRRHARKPSEPH